MYVTRSVNLLHFISRIILMLFLFIFLLAYMFSLELGDLLAPMIVIISIAEIFVLYFNSNVKNTGLVMMFFLYTLFCHNGFVIAYFFDSSYINFRSTTTMAYIENDYYAQAILISNIVMIIYVLATEIRVYKNKRNVSRNNSNLAIIGNPIADYMGIGIVFIGTVFLAYVISRNNLFGLLYSDIINITQEIPLIQHSVIMTSIAVALLFSAGTKKGIQYGMLIFAFDILLHFSIGNRGEVFYAIITCLALYSLRFGDFKKKHLIIIGTSIIVLIPLVRIMREGKLEAYMLNPMTSFLDVLAELGFQISPFTYIVQYVKEGNNHVWGMTYVNYFLDFILRRIGLRSPWITTEQYVIKQIMPYDGMAFSMIAEIFYNFTLVGASMIYAFFARIILSFDLKISTGNISTSKKIFFSMLMVEMINLTRNDSSTLPVYLCYILIIYSIFYCINWAIYKKRSSILT